MSTDIPEGYGLITGHSKELARAALAAARQAGVAVEEVRSVSEGYLVPTSVLDAYEEASTSEPTPEPAGTEESERDLESMTVAELKSFAKDYKPEEIDLGEATKKADIISVIRESTKE